MTTRVERVEFRQILPLRALFLQEMNAQVRYDACHARGWSDSYLLWVDGAAVGYGSIKGEEIADRDTVFEFFVLPSFRDRSSHLFRELLSASGAGRIECQSNDASLSAQLFEHARDIGSEVVLFADHTVTAHAIADASVRRRRDDDVPFPHGSEPVGDFVLEVGGDVVATGGFLLHYNAPFADLYMETREDRRRQGFASLLLQEVKRECYLAGRVPAARCNLRNVASRGALRRAGMRECGFMLRGAVAVR